MLKGHIHIFYFSTYYISSNMKMKPLDYFTRQWVRQSPRSITLTKAEYMEVPF